MKLDQEDRDNKDSSDPMLDFFDRRRNSDRFHLNKTIMGGRFILPKVKHSKLQHML